MTPLIPYLLLGWSALVAIASVAAYLRLIQKHRRLIDRHFAAQDCLLKSCRTSLFFNSQSLYRIYQVTYQDHTGRIHQAKAQVGPHRHVLIRHERVLQPGSGPPPIPVQEQIRLLERENETLRQEIFRLTEEHQ